MPGRRYKYMICTFLWELSCCIFYKVPFWFIWKNHMKRYARWKNSNFYFASIHLFLMLTFLCVTGHFRAKNSEFGKFCATLSSNPPQQHDISMRWNHNFVEEGLGFKYTIYFGMLHFYFWRIWKSTWSIKSCGTKWLALY